MARTKAFDRNEVLTKAMNLFWKKGYHATSIQDLVDHLGINRGSIYATFIGKDELYQEAVKLYRQQNATALKEFLQQQSSVKEAIKALMYSNLNEAKCDPDKKGCFIVNCTTEYLPTHNESINLVDENRTIFLKTMTAFIQSGIDSGELNTSSNAHSLANLVYTFFSGMMVVSKTSNNYAELGKSIELVMGLF